MLPSANLSSPIASPDVSSAPGGAPTPYPNIAMLNSCIPATMNAVIVQVGDVLHFGPGAATFTAGNLLTNGPASYGDDAGVALGVVSNMVVGSGSSVLGSLKTFNGIAPSAKLTSVQTANNSNLTGLNLVPANAKVTVLA